MTVSLTEKHMTKQEIAEQFVNGNKEKVIFELMRADGTMDVLGRAFDVYQFIRGWYGNLEALRFSNWLQSYAKE